MTERSERRPLLIVNPHASGGKTGRVFDSLRALIERAIGPFDVVLTERSRHALELAREASLAGAEVVVAVGGDGTIHEVVNGLMEAKDRGAAGTKLAMIAQGTGGDLRRTVGIEHRLEHYVAVIAGGKTRKLDVGRFSYVTHQGVEASGFFINILSVGLGGLVDRYVAEASRRFGGAFAYFGASARGLLLSELGVLRCTIGHDGETREEEITSRNLAVCNGRFFGSGMMVAPMAELDDGVFEVVDLGKASKVRFALVSSTRIYSGEHIGHPDVRHFRCDKIKLELKNEAVAERFLIDADGEPLGRLPVEIELMPSALEVLVP